MLHFYFASSPANPGAGLENTLVFKSLGLISHLHTAKE